VYEIQLLIVKADYISTRRSYRYEPIYSREKL